MSKGKGSPRGNPDPLGQYTVGDALESIIAPQASANQANLRLAQYQWNNEIDMWNRQNAYNTPANQMQRYIDAGLNPNLVASQGNPGNAGNYPRYQAPTMQPVDLMGNMVGILSAYQDLKLKSAQTSNYEANAKINAVRAEFEADTQWMKLLKMHQDNEITNAQLFDAKQKLESLYGVRINGLGVPRKHKFSDMEVGDTTMAQEYRTAFRKGTLNELEKTSLEVQGEKLNNELKDLARKSFVFDKILNGLRVGSSFLSPIKIQK